MTFDSPNEQLLGELFFCGFVISQDDFDGSPRALEIQLLSLCKEIQCQERYMLAKIFETFLDVPAYPVHSCTFF